MDASFEKLSRRAKHLGLSLEEVEKAADRSRLAIKHSVEDQFRALAGLGPTLESALGSLNDQIIKLSADARAVGIGEDVIAKLSGQAISNARGQFLSPLETARSGALSFLGQGAKPDIDALKQAIMDAETPQAAADAIANLGAAVDSTVAQLDAMSNAAKTLNDYLTGLATSDLSNLTPDQRYKTSKADFQSAFTKAQAGDATAAADLPNLANRFLNESRNMFSSGAPYGADYKMVTDAVSAIASRQSAAGAATGPTVQGMTTQSDAAQFIAKAADQLIQKFSAAFDTTQAAAAATAPAPIVKSAVDLIEDEIAALEDQKYAIKGNGPKKKAERKAIQDQIDALKKRKRIELKKKASGGWTSGLTLVGEMGPEIIDVPRAALVTNHRQTQNVLANGADKQVAELQAQTKELQALVRLQAAANKALLDELKASREHLYDIDRRQRLAG